MSNEKKTIVMLLLFGILVFGLSAYAFIGEKQTVSASERRELAQLPELTKEALLDKSYMSDFETYSLDQFPFRELFRCIKAVVAYQVLGRKDNNGIYIEGNHIGKMEYPYDKEMLHYATDKFQSIYDANIEGTDATVYVAMIPDKHAYLAEEGYLAMDYEAIQKELAKNMSYAKALNIMGLLERNDYYYTDSHWRQEKIVDLAQALAAAMGTSVSGLNSYTVHTLEKPFFGVYAGQSAMKVKGEPLHYLTSDILDQCIVTSYATGKPEVMDMYDMEKAAGKDPYELFLGGSEPLVTIENPNATTDKELVVFRDSFGSSIAPLLAEGYKTVTLIDIRYMQSQAIPAFVQFTDQDVLFLYSTSLLNNSTALR